MVYPETRSRRQIWEWVVEFNNAGRVDAEARCEIELPPGATVSRLTLWINGEEREAAFAEMAAEVLRELSGTMRRYEMRREKAEAATSGAESNLHLARLWAFDEINRLVKAGDRSRAIEIAALYQLVSEVSGAVVLETAEQYKQAGLTPVSPTSVPTVPEPGTWALMIAGAIALAWYGKRRRNVEATARKTAVAAMV